MAGQEDDLGLELRLPWDRAPQRAARVEEPAPGPPPTTADPPPPVVQSPAGPVLAPAGWVVAPAPASSVLDAEEVQRSLETLLLVIEGRFDRIEERLVHVERGGGTAPPASLVTAEQIEERISSASQEIERRIERLEALVTASHRVTIEAVGQLAANGGPDEALSPDVVVRLERIEALLAAPVSPDVQAVAALANAVAELATRLDVLDGALQGRTDQISSRIDSSHRAILGALGDLVPRGMVAELVEGLAARGESIDDELTELRRLLARSDVLRSLDSHS